MARGKVFSWIKEFYPQYIGIKRYPADQCVFVKTAADEWGILGNFGRAAVVVNGVEFSNTEKLFQCMKFTYAPVIQEIYAQNNMSIKMKARKKEYEQYVREDWKKIFLDALKFVLVTKIAKYSPLICCRLDQCTLIGWIALYAYVLWIILFYPRKNFTSCHILYVLSVNKYVLFALEFYLYLLHLNDLHISRIKHSNILQTVRFGLCLRPHII